MSLDRLRTVRQLSERNPAFSEASIRWLVFNSRTNGLDRAIVRIGKPGSRRPKLLIDEVEFGRWLSDQGAVRLHVGGAGAGKTHVTESLCMAIATRQEG